MKTKVVLATGPSGVGEKKFLTDSIRYCTERDKKVKVYDIARLMYGFADEIGDELPKENILNVDIDRRASLRSSVLKDVLTEINRVEDLDAAVVCLHETFYWNKCFQPAHDRFLSSKRFKPDMYITFIDDFRRISERLRARPQWQDQNLTYAEILAWLNNEVIFTRGRAQRSDKPFFVIPTSEKQSISTLYKLMFCPEMPQVYVAMPISHFQDPIEREKINKFIEKLNNYFVVFNPLAVEIVGAASVDDFQDTERITINHHVVNRDLKWFVHQSKKLIAYWPGPVASPGLSIETYEAFIKGKDVWVIYLGKEASPFTTSFTTHSKLFESEGEFFEFLDKKYPERKNLSW